MKHVYDDLVAVIKYIGFSPLNISVEYYIRHHNAFEDFCTEDLEPSARSCLVV